MTVNEVLEAHRIITQCDMGKYSRRWWLDITAFGWRGLTLVREPLSVHHDALGSIQARELLQVGIRVHAHVRRQRPEQLLDPKALILSHDTGRHRSVIHRSVGS